MTTKLQRKAPVWLLILSGLYGTILAVLMLLNRLGADRWWFGAFNLYLPQVIWLIPGIVLLLICLKMARHWIWLPLLGVAWVLGPIMGFCWSFHKPPESSGSVPVRVMTWNVKYGTHAKLSLVSIMYEIDWNKPDIVLLQDASGLLDGPLGNYFRKWHVQTDGQYIIASRLPLSAAEAPSISFLGGKETCLRCRVQIGSATVTLYNVHFESPRDGLNAIKTARENPWSLPGAIQRLEQGVFARVIQASRVREFIRQEQGPVIVAGDLNSPDSSLVCARLRDVGLHDAFAEGGRGYGYSYGHFLLKHRLPQVHVSWMRIDHIMVSSQLRAQHSWAGTWEASDHRPVIADLVLGHN